MTAEIRLAGSGHWQRLSPAAVELISGNFP